MLSAAICIAGCWLRARLIADPYSLVDSWSVSIVSAVVQLTYCIAICIALFYFSVLLLLDSLLSRYQSLIASSEMLVDVHMLLKSSSSCEEV